MHRSTRFALGLAVFLALALVAVAKRAPLWPEQFNAHFDVKVTAYGPEFLKKGRVYYDYTRRAMRADYYDWCIPLFGPVKSAGTYNHTCTFLQTKEATYFISPDFPVVEDRCCVFAISLPPPTPDWLTNCQYNGTTTLNGKKVDVWWFPGTSDPENPYYGYFDTVDDHTPVRFLGLSSIGETYLDYTSFTVGPSMDSSLFEVPPNCDAECIDPDEPSEGGPPSYHSPRPTGFTEIAVQ